MSFWLLLTNLLKSHIYEIQLTEITFSKVVRFGFLDHLVSSTELYTKTEFCDCSIKHSSFIRFILALFCWVFCSTVFWVQLVFTYTELFYISIPIRYNLLSKSLFKISCMIALLKRFKSVKSAYLHTFAVEKKKVHFLWLILLLFQRIVVSTSLVCNELFFQPKTFRQSWSFYWFNGWHMSIYSFERQKSLVSYPSSTKLLTPSTSNTSMSNIIQKKSKFYR